MPSRHYRDGPQLPKEVGDVRTSCLRARSVANRLHIIICSIRAPFSVARFVISGGYYHGSFESVLKSIVRLQLQNKAPYLTS